MRARLVVRAAGALLAVTLAAACGADRTDVAAKAPLEATPWELDISTVQVPGIEKAQPTEQWIARNQPSPVASDRVEFERAPLGRRTEAGMHTDGARS